MWILGLKGLKCTHPQTHLKIFLQRIFSLLASLLRAAYTNLKTGGGNQNELPQHCTIHNLTTFKTFPPTFFFVCLLAVADFFLFCTTLKSIAAFPQSL